MGVSGGVFAGSNGHGGGDQHHVGGGGGGGRGGSGGGVTSLGGEPTRLLAQVTARPGTRAAVSLSATLQSRDGGGGGGGGGDGGGGVAVASSYAAATASTASSAQPSTTAAAPTSRPGLSRLDASRVAHDLQPPANPHPPTPTTLGALHERSSGAASAESFKTMGLSAQGLAAVGDRTLIATWQDRPFTVTHTHTNNTHTHTHTHTHLYQYVRLNVGV